MRRTCEIAECERLFVARGMCAAHYRRWSLGRPVDAPMVPRSRPLSERFWEKVDIQGPDDCWEWMAGLDTRGYGQIQVGGRGGSRLAHRVAYELHKGLPVGSLRSDEYVCHNCDNPRCVNPTHLWLGDHQANQDDCTRKGRRVLPPPMSGEAHPNAKLTEEQAIAIFLDPTPVGLIARRHGVTVSCVEDIKARRTWRRATAWITNREETA